MRWWSGGLGGWAAGERKSGSALQAEGSRRRGSHEQATRSGGGIGTVKRAEKQDDAIIRKGSLFCSMHNLQLEPPHVVGVHACLTRNTRER